MFVNERYADFRIQKIWTRDVQVAADEISKFNLPIEGIEKQHSSKDEVKPLRQGIGSTFQKESKHNLQYENTILLELITKL